VNVEQYFIIHLNYSEVLEKEQFWGRFSFGAGLISVQAYHLWSKTSFRAGPVLSRHNYGAGLLWVQAYFWNRPSLGEGLV